MRIGKCAAILLLAVCTSVPNGTAQENEALLDELLSELDESPVAKSDGSVVTIVAANDSGAKDDATDDLLSDLLDEPESSGEAAADAGADDAWMSELDAGVAGTGTVRELDSDIESLLGESTDAVAEDVGEVMPAAVGSIDIPEAAAEPEPASVEEEMETMLSPAELQQQANDIAREEAVLMRVAKLDGLEKLGEGFTALSDKRYETAALAFEQALLLIPDTPDTADDLEQARWGQSEVSYKLAQVLYKEGDAAGAKSAVDRAVKFTPNHRGALRLQRKVDKHIATYGITAPYVDVRDRPETLVLRSTIKKLHKEGIDFYKNGMLDQAEERFDQIRLLDEYNIEAMRALKKVEQRRYKLARIAHETTVATYIKQVEEAWNPPLRTDVEKPELDTSNIGSVRADVETQALVRKMNDLIIPSIAFRKANIIDVVEELRKESEKADDEGIGINIVLKLTAKRRPQPVDDLGPPGFPNLGGGGFDDGFGRPPPLARAASAISHFQAAADSPRPDRETNSDSAMSSPAGTHSRTIRSKRICRVRSSPCLQLRSPCGGYR